MRPPPRRPGASEAGFRRVLSVHLLLVVLVVAGGGCLSGDATPGTPDAPTDTASETPATLETPQTPETTATPSTGVHGSPYPVTIRVEAAPVDDASVSLLNVPTVEDANFTERERRLLVDLLANSTTPRWSGLSNETAPADIRTLVAVSDRLPPSRASRDPAEAWRVARGTEGYVVYGNATYRVAMVKVAP